MFTFTRGWRGSPAKNSTILALIVSDLLDRMSSRPVWIARALAVPRSLSISIEYRALACSRATWMCGLARALPRAVSFMPHRLAASRCVVPSRAIASMAVRMRALMRSVFPPSRGVVLVLLLLREVGVIGAGWGRHRSGSMHGGVSAVCSHIPALHPLQWCSLCAM